MIQDKQQTFSDEQAITATANSTNVVDLGSANKGPGEPLYVNAQVIEAFTAGGSATLTISLETDDNDGFSSAKTLLTTPAIGKADLIAGYMLAINQVPPGAERYLRLVYTVASGPMTAGKITAFIGGPYQSNT